MKLKSILIFSILLSTTTIYGKKNLEFESGYIITNRGDTIHGELVVFEKTKSQLVIQFKNDSKKYRAHKKEVRAYKRGNKLFELKTFILSWKFSYSQRFLQVVSKGKVNLYLYISKIPDYIPPKYVEEYYVEKQFNKLVYVKKVNFRKKFVPLFSDHEELAKSIKNKELKYHEIVEIVKIYNQHFMKK